MDDLLLFASTKKITHGKIRRIVKGITHKWIEKITQEMSDF